MKPRSKSFETADVPGAIRSRSGLGEKKTTRPAKAKSAVSIAEAAETQAASTRLTTKDVSEPPRISADDISRRAHEIWLREGQPEGKDREHWFRAEHELRKERNA